MVKPSMIISYIDLLPKYHWQTHSCWLVFGVLHIVAWLDQSSHNAQDYPCQSGWHNLPRSIGHKSSIIHIMYEWSMCHIYGHIVHVNECHGVHSLAMPYLGCAKVTRGAKSLWCSAGRGPAGGNPEIVSQKADLNCCLCNLWGGCGNLWQLWPLLRR